LDGGMFVKLIRYVLIIICSLIILPSNSSAAPSEEELTQYLSKLNWTLEELEEYLDFYELDLSHFETMAELQKALGTPITRENLQDLLASLNLSLEDAEDLLSQFGESILDYKFIENLELAINFYVHHNHDLAGIADFLSYIGLTNEEITSLFNHISSLQQKTLHLKINQLDTRLKKFHVNEE
jgi:processed acidic surface protein